MTDSSFWIVTRRIFEIAGMVFIGLVLPAVVLFYGFVLKPAFASLEKPKTELEQSQELTLSYTSLDLSHKSIVSVSRLYEIIRDSIGEHDDFAEGLPEGSVRFYRRGDSLAAILRYNLDCGCPAESEKYDVVSYSVRFADSIPMVHSSVYVRGLNHSEYNQLAVVGVSIEKDAPSNEVPDDNLRAHAEESAGVENNRNRRERR